MQATFTEKAATAIQRTREKLAATGSSRAASLTAHEKAVLAAVAQHALALALAAEDRAARLERELAAMQARLAAVEARPMGMKYAGIWDDRETYGAGDVVSDRNSLWYAWEQTSERPGEGATAWQMVMRRPR